MGRWRGGGGGVSPSPSICIHTQWSTEVGCSRWLLPHLLSFHLSVPRTDTQETSGQTLETQFDRSVSLGQSAPTHHGHWNTHPSTHPIIAIHTISFRGGKKKQCSLLHSAAIHTVNLELTKALTPSHAPSMGCFGVLIFWRQRWDSRKSQITESSLSWHFCPDTDQLSKSCDSTSSSVKWR